MASDGAGIGVTTAPPIEAILRRDRIVVVVGLVLVIGLAWAYVLAGAGTGMTAFQMTAATGADGMAATSMTPAWYAGQAVVMFFMWWVMMVAMMLPSAAPMALLFAAINRRQRARAAPYVATGYFLSGYLLAWAGFSLIAVGLQWLLDQSGLLSAMMQSTSAVLGGVLLVVAGLWQITPLKHACLRHCRSPVFYITTHWRSGRLGALKMGLGHGGFCLGCCWFLMVLLFYGGVMNLYWIIGLAVYVLIEKVVPAGQRLALLVGPVLVAWGVVLIWRAL